MRKLSDMIKGSQNAIRPNIQHAGQARGGERATLSSSILSTFRRGKGGRGA